MASPLSLASIFLVLGLALASHHHHHHKSSELDLTPTERHIKETVDNFITGGYREKDPTYRGGCCMQDVVIDVGKLQLKKKIEPEVFTAWKCLGSCIKQNPLLGEEPEIPGDCRAATHIALMAAFDDDDGQSQIRLIPNTIVQSCACF